MRSCRGSTEAQSATPKTQFPLPLARVLHLPLRKTDRLPAGAWQHRIFAPLAAAVGQTPGIRAANKRRGTRLLKRGEFRWTPVFQPGSRCQPDFLIRRENG